MRIDIKIVFVVLCGWVLLASCSEKLTLTCPECDNYRFHFADSMYLLVTAKNNDTNLLTRTSLTNLFYEAVPKAREQGHDTIYMNVYNSDNEFVCQLYGRPVAIKIDWAYEEHSEFY